MTPMTPMTAAPKLPAAEFSRPLNAAGLGKGERRLVIEATGAERAGLAERFAIQALESLSADIVLTTDDHGEGGRRVAAVGRLKARVVQLCVVSLEPVTTVIDAAFERLFVEGAPENGWEWGPEDVEIHLDENLKDAPDTMTGGFFDLGEALAEQLALEIPPFPRAEAAFLKENPGGIEPEEGWKAEETSGESPFAVLKKLKPGRG